MNALVHDAMAVATAINALRLKTHRLRAVPGGVEVHQRGKPVLLLTHEAARADRGSGT